MVKVKVEFECGEKTCAKEPGVFCKFCSISLFGIGQCTLFDNRRLFDENGWLMRHEECLELKEEK